MSFRIVTPVRDKLVIQKLTWEKIIHIVAAGSVIDLLIW